MAESFYGKDLTIHFSNGGGEALFQGLIQLGRDLPAEKTRSELIEYLQYSVDNFGYGCRFFSLEKLPEELNHQHLAEFAGLIDLHCIELTKAESKLEECGLGWWHEKRMDFLARLSILYSEIETILREKSIFLPKQKIPLSPAETITVERERLLIVYNQTKNRLNNAERLNLWEKIVGLYEQDRSVTNLEILSLAYLEYIGLIDNSVSEEKNISICKRLLEIEEQIGDQESIELVKEFLKDAQKE